MQCVRVAVGTMYLNSQNTQNVATLVLMYNVSCHLSITSCSREEMSQGPGAGAGNEVSFLPDT